MLERTVLFVGPVALDEPRLEHFVPALEALRVVAPVDARGDRFPVALAKLLDRLAQRSVLLGRPALALFVLGLRFLRLPGRLVDQRVQERRRAFPAYSNQVNYEAL